MLTHPSRADLRGDAETVLRWLRQETFAFPPRREMTRLAEAALRRNGPPHR